MNEEINSLKDKYVDLYDFYDNKEKALKELQKQLNTSFETAVESNQTLSFESFDKKRNAIVSEADYLPNENLNPAYNLSSVESNCIYICPYCSTETKANSNIDGNNVFCTNCGQIFKINESSDDITPEESEELNSRNYTKSFDKGSRIKKAVAVILIGAIIVTIITLINLFK
jgi:transcription elongation factor Elf1